MLHDAAQNEDEGCTDDTDSEVAEDWDDGATLFSGVMENDCP